MIKTISSEIDYKNLSEPATKIIALKDFDFEGEVLERLDMTMEQFCLGYQELVSKGYIKNYICCVF